MNTSIYDIATVLALLGVVWAKIPQQRLGQLLKNIAGPGHDPYYIEVNEIIQALDFYNKNGKFEWQA